MKPTLNLWLSKSARLPGVLACGVRYTDRSAFTQCWAPGYNDEAVENCLRCASDSFQVLQLNRFQARSVRWVYEKALVIASRRADCVCLGLIVAREGTPCDPADLDRLVLEFQSLPT